MGRSSAGTGAHLALAPAPACRDAAAAGTVSTAPVAIGAKANRPVLGAVQDAVIGACGGRHRLHRSGGVGHAQAFRAPPARASTPCATSGLMLGSHHLIGAKANRPVLGAVQKCALPALLASDAEVAARFAAPGAEEGEVDDLSAREARPPRRTPCWAPSAARSWATGRPRRCSRRRTSLSTRRANCNCVTASRAPRRRRALASPSPSARCAAARRWTWPAALRWALPSAEVVRRGATAEGVSWLERRGCEVLRAAAIAPGGARASGVSCQGGAGDAARLGEAGARAWYS